jgi:hypothetical protein
MIDDKRRGQKTVQCSRLLIAVQMDAKDFLYCTRRMSLRLSSYYGRVYIQEV